MLRLFFAALAGGIFGAGLLISGMTDTRKVQGWLDIFGSWDPTLAFVITGALLPMALAWAVADRRRQAVLGGPLPTRATPVIDRDLVLGSVLFGAGWALAGLCPGPALATLGLNGIGGGLFLLAMVGGMVAANMRRRAV